MYPGKKWPLWGCHFVFSGWNIELQLLCLKNVFYSVKPTILEVTVSKTSVNYKLSEIPFSQNYPYVDPILWL